VRRIEFSFARGLERRPWRGGIAQAIPSARRCGASAPRRRRARCRRVEYNLAPDVAGETPAGDITRPRQGVSGSIWVGANPSLASDRIGGRHAKGVTSVRAAPGPIPPGWPRLPQGSSGATRDQKLCAWATRHTVRGVRTVRGRARRSLGIAEVVERRGAHTSLGAKSALENHGEGLASPRESIGEAKQRRKPKRDGKVSRSVAGSELPEGFLEHSAMEGALGRESRPR